MNKTTFIPVYKRKLDSEHWPRSEKYDQKSLNGRSHRLRPDSDRVRCPGPSRPKIFVARLRLKNYQEVEVNSFVKFLTIVYSQKVARGFIHNFIERFEAVFR